MSARLDFLPYSLHLGAPGCWCRPERGEDVGEFELWRHRDDVEPPAWVVAAHEAQQGA